MNNTQDKINQLVQQLEAIQNNVCNQITALPDNPNIQRINDNCFVMNKSDLTNQSWSPEYYDFKKQYRLIIDAIKRTKPQNVITKLKTIIEEKAVYIYIGAGGNNFVRHNAKKYKQPLHSDVVNHLKTL